MRTTVDLDDVVLAAARAKAQLEGVSLGKALSRLAMSGLSAEKVSVSDAFPILEAVPGHVITDDLVERYRDDD